jgi:cyclophilin family peptidyl-prolyl cis-trans isomerase
MKLARLSSLLFVLAVLACLTGAAMAADAVTKAAPKAASPAASDPAIKAIDAQIAAAKIDKKAPNWKTALTLPKAVKFSADKKYFVRMTTSKGEILIRFMPDIAPLHVTNFIYLARMGFYDGTTFHRVIQGFMAQGGDPLGTGMGGPGYGFNSEFSENVKHDHAGMLSMANTGQPGSDGSQFFLTFVATPWLNGKHTIFGEVVEGLDVLKKLEAAGSRTGATTEHLTLDKVVVEVK